MDHPSDHDIRVSLRARGVRKRYRTGLLCLALGAVVLLATHVGPSLLGVQNSSDPVSLRPAPGRKGVAVRLPRGEVLLFRLLQDFANFTGEPVYAQGDILPNATIRIEKKPTGLDVSSVKSLLAKHSYQLTRASYRDREVFWVQKLLVLPRQKGGLTPSRGARKGGAALATVDDGVDQGRDSGSTTLCLYRRQNGDGPRYAVLFETNSKKAAEDALSLLEAHKRSLPSR